MVKYQFNKLHTVYSYPAKLASKPLPIVTTMTFVSTKQQNSTSAAVTRKLHSSQLKARSYTVKIDIPNPVVASNSLNN